MLIEFLKPDFSFEDARGSLVQLVHGGWEQVNVIRSRAGVLRGGHYHARSTEAFYVVSGRFELALEGLDSGEREEHCLKAGAFFRIRPGVLHSFHFLEETVLVSLYDRPVEGEGGTKDILTR